MKLQLCTPTFFSPTPSSLPTPWPTVTDNSNPSKTPKANTPTSFSPAPSSLPTPTGGTSAFRDTSTVVFDDIFHVLWASTETSLGVILWYTMHVVYHFGVWKFVEWQDNSLFVIWYPCSILLSGAISLFLCWKITEPDGGPKSEPELYKDKDVDNLFADFRLPLAKPMIVGLCQFIFYIIYAQHLYVTFEVKNDEDHFKEGTAKEEKDFWFMVDMDRKHSQVVLFLFGSFLQVALAICRNDYDNMINCVQFWFDAFRFANKSGVLKFQYVKDGVAEPEEEIRHLHMMCLSFSSFVVNVIVRVCIEYLLPFQLSMSANAHAMMFNVLSAYFIIGLDDLSVPLKVKFILQGQGQEMDVEAAVGLDWGRRGWNSTPNGLGTNSRAQCRTVDSSIVRRIHSSSN